MRAFYWYFIYASIILTLSLAFVIGKWLFFLGGNAAGWYLRRKSQARKEAILLQAKREEKSHYAKQHPPPRPVDGDWEKVESYASGPTINGGPAGDDWEGLIGFFHPFW